MEYFLICANKRKGRGKNNFIRKLEILDWLYDSLRSISNLPTSLFPSFVKTGLTMWR